MMPTPMNAKMFVSGAVSTAMRQRISATRGSKVTGAEVDAVVLGGTGGIGGVVGGLDGVRTPDASEDSAGAVAEVASGAGPDAGSADFESAACTGSSPATDDAATHRDRIGSCTQVALVMEPIAASRLSSMKSTGPNVLPSCDQCHCARESVESAFIV